jgi:hypothetical protein
VAGELEQQVLASLGANLNASEIRVLYILRNDEYGWHISLISGPRG